MSTGATFDPTDYPGRDGGCWCARCDGQRRATKVASSEMTLMQAMCCFMIVCPDCGNKRCPHATDHEDPCTGSNEFGQEGSAYRTDPDVQEMLRDLPSPDAARWKP
jgi:hypothetical protein